MASVRRPRDHRAVVVIASVSSALASAYLALAGFFDALRSGPLLVGSVAVVAGIAVGSTTGRLVIQRNTDAVMNKRLTLRSALDTGCVAFHNISSEGVEQFGASILLVDRPRFGEARLWSVVQGGLAQHPPTRIEWFPGKGIVGRCWEEGVTQFADLNRLVHDQANASAAQWMSLDSTTTMNLSLDEWRRTSPYFGTIVAACIFDQNARIVGVVAVHAPPVIDVSSHERELRDATEALAVVLANVVE